MLAVAKRFERGPIRVSAFPYVFRMANFRLKIIERRSESSVATGGEVGNYWCMFVK